MTHPDPLRVIVFGAGVMGAHHVRVLRRDPDVELVAVVDPDGDRADALADGTGALGMTSWNGEHVDAAIVATPTPTHFDTALPLLKAGIHTLIEKPIAETPDKGRQLDESARLSGTLLMVGHVERFNPAVRYLVESGESPLDISIRRISPFPARIKDSVVLDLMIHDIDLAMLLMGGRPLAVHAAGRTFQSDDIDIAHVVLEFPHGMASLQASRSGQQKIREICATYHDRFVVADLIRQDVSLTRLASVSFESTRGQALQQSGYVEVPFLSSRGESLANEHAAFFNAIRSGSATPCGAEDAIAALEVAGTIERACLSGA